MVDLANRFSLEVTMLVNQSVPFKLRAQETVAFVCIVTNQIRLIKLIRGWLKLTKIVNCGMIMLTLHNLMFELTVHGMSGWVACIGYNIVVAE